MSGPPPPAAPAAGEVHVYTYSSTRVRTRVPVSAPFARARSARSATPGGWQHLESPGPDSSNTCARCLLAGCVGPGVLGFSSLASPCACDGAASSACLPLWGPFVWRKGPVFCWANPNRRTEGCRDAGSTQGRGAHYLPLGCFTCLPSLCSLDPPVRTHALTLFSVRAVRPTPPRPARE